MNIFLTNFPPQPSASLFCHLSTFTICYSTYIFSSIIRILKVLIRTSDYGGTRASDVMAEKVLSRPERVDFSFDSQKPLIYANTLHTLAPARRIPIEVMQEIFVRCLSPGDYIRPDPAKAPLLLCQVSVGWRNAALSTPQLWNSLAIQLFQHHCRPRVALMQSWLARSGDLPLSLFAYAPTAADESLLALFQIFHSSIRRCKYLRLTLPQRCHEQMLWLLNGGTPLLERLEIRFAASHEATIAGMEEKLLLSVKSAPCLRSFSWSSQNLRRDIFAFHWNELTDIDVDYSLSISDCINIMRACPKLHTCDFKSTREVNSIPSSDILSFPRITLRELRSFTAHMTQPLHPFFDCLTLPSLHELKLMDLGRKGDPLIWSQDGFTSFLRRSGCSIRVLHLLNVLSSEGQLIDCLELASPSLVDICVLDYRESLRVQDRVLDLLTVNIAPDGQITCLCPKLEIMKLGPCLYSTDGKLADMIESRWNLAFAIPVNKPCQSPPRQQGFYIDTEVVASLKLINPRLGADHPEDIRRLTQLLRIA